MKIESIRAELCGSATAAEAYTLITVSLRLPGENLVAGLMGALSFTGDIARLNDRLAAEASRDPINPAPTAEEIAAAAVEKVVNPPAVDNGEATTTRRRRHTNPLEAAPAAQENPTSAAATADATHTNAVPAGQSSAVEGRRRRRSAPDAASTTPEADPTATSPAPSNAPEEPRRRRRTAETAETSSPAVAATSEITDADLSKAASEGARVLTPKVVQALLATFGVKSVQELKGGQRRAFIDGLRAKKEAT